MIFFKRQLISCILALLFIFSSCTLLSRYHRNVLHDLIALCRDLPVLAESEDSAVKKAEDLEKKLKKAGTSLAFFVNYSDLNEAYLCAANLKYAAQQGNDLEYDRARIALSEALDTLLRAETLSIKTLI